MRAEEIKLYARILSIQAQADEIKTEIIGAQMDNEIRKMRGLDTFNYDHDYFAGQAERLAGIATALENVW